MARILFWVFIVFLVWFAVRWVAASRQRGDAVDATPGTARVKPSDTVEPMRQCSWCGAHLPAHEALALTDGRAYCSAQHREAAIHADGAASAATRGPDA